MRSGSRAAADLPPFIGRRRELAALRKLLEDARRGMAAVAMLSGEPGIGKTATARIFAELARGEGFRVLWGACYETESSAPFGPWAQAVSPALRDIDLEARFGPAAAVLAGVVPARGDALIQTSRVAPLASDEARLRAYDAFAQALVALADERVVVVLDDLHWADPASLGLLGHIGRIVSTVPIVLVGTYREAELELTHPLAQTLADLDRHVRIRRIPLDVLGATEVRSLLAAVADGPISRRFAETVARETGGNPFFVSEVALQLSSTGAPLDEIPVPDSVRQAVGQRLARLTPETARVLSVAAAFARPFRFDALEALTELEEDALLDCVDEALRGRMLVASDGERYEFAHALVRHAIYDELSPSRQARLHRRIAEALERLGGQVDASELASQYYRSRTLPGAEHGYRYAVAAAEHAKERYAYEQAVVFLQMALELAAESDERLRADIAARLAEAQAEAVMVDEARQSTEVALALLESSGAAPDDKADFVRRAAWALDDAGAPRASIQPLVQRGLAVAGRRRGLVWARLKLAEYPLEMFRVDGVLAGRWLGFDPHAVAIARSDGDERDYAKTIELMDWRDRVETEELRALAGGWGDDRAAIHVLGVVTRSLLFQHCALAEAADVAQELRERAERVGSRSGHAYALVALSTAAFHRGDFNRARAFADDARAVVARLGGGHRQHASLRFLDHKLMQAEGLSWPEIAARYEADAADPELPPWMVLIHLSSAAQAHAAAGEQAAARRVLVDLVPALERLPPTTLNQNGAVANAAWAAWVIGAAEFAASLRQTAKAVIAAGVGDYPGTSSELAVAWMSILDGDRPEALTYLQRARGTMTAEGQLPLLRHVDEAEQELGGDRRERPAGLTPREIEILRAVAAGQSNREIASTLVLSVHTIERHIANIYRKIGVRNRAEATAFALRERL
jgi:DNA-binding NarL/FixJ family response regulator